MTMWTEEQKKAIESRNTNILLSAAAGSGKTTVLVERVLQLIREGTDIDRMLIVTFTRAASADMREKLTEKLSALISQEPRYKKQLLLMEHASISTLHSFCSDFLRTNFEAARIDPSFRLVDDTEMAEMTDRALDESVENAYADRDEAMTLLNNGRGPVKVREMAAILLKALNEQPEPEEWLNIVCEQGPELRAKWINELVTAAKETINNAIELLRIAYDHPDCNENYASVIEKDVPRLEAMLKTADSGYDALQREICDFKLSRPGNKKTTPIGDVPKDLRKKAGELIKNIPVGSIALAPLLTDAEAIRPVLRKLADIALHARDLIDQRKRAAAILTYNDLEHFTIRALKDDAAAQSVRDRYDYIFVDEYQDTSLLQEYIISRIVRKSNLFMVGDVKQSIYRFRHAEPGIFRRKYDEYSRGEGGTLLHLTRNFRSCPAIINFVNRVFEECMTGGRTEILYDANAHLHHGNLLLNGGNVEMHVLRKPDAADGEADEFSEGADSIKQEAVFIANRIRELKAADPELRYRDIAILSRSGKGLLARMAMILIAMGIPAYAQSADSYYESIEVQLAFALLKLVKNRRSDVELIGVLHSPVVGISVTDLSIIRAEYPAGAYCDAVSKYAREKDDALSHRLSVFAHQLDQWQTIAENTGLGYFTRTLFMQSGLYNIARVLPASAQRIANLDRIVSDAERYDRDISSSLTLFLDLLEHRRENNDVGDVSTLSESDDVVRLMTVHKSKGLEYRVVFGAMLGKGFNKKEAISSLAVHNELGLSCEFKDPTLRTSRKTLCRYAVDHRLAQENFAEELRILYVMLTRAKEQLILVGTVKDPEKLKNTVWQAESKDCYLNIILSAVASGKDELCKTVYHSDRIFVSLKDQNTEEPEDRPSDPEITKAILWQYPFADAASLPMKLSVSGILRQIQSPVIPERFGERPRFMMTSPGKLTGTERGTAYHRVMQCLDLNALRATHPEHYRTEITRQIEKMLISNRLSEVESKAVKPDVIARFFNGDIGVRMLASSEVRREWSFNARMNIADVLTLEERGRWGNGEIMVQGTIDACFRENGKWILIDYKTDRADDAEALTARYSDQLRMYAYALSSATGIPVAEIRLCLLLSDETIRFTP